MGRPSTQYSGSEKMANLQEHLIEQVPMSEVCSGSTSS